MITIHENVNFTDRTSGTWLPDCSKLAINQKNNNAINLAAKYHHQFFLCCLVFLLSSLVTGPVFMSLSLMVIEL